MSKEKIVLFSLLFIQYSCQIHEYECVCYYEEDGKINYDKYITKNTRTEAEFYCDKLSTDSKKCVITEF